MVEEYRKERSKDISINIQANEINEIREKSLEKNSARMFHDNKIFASNYLGELSQDELKERALPNEAGALDCNYEFESDLNLDAVGGVKLSDEKVVSLTADFIAFFQKELPDFMYSGKVDHVDVESETTTSQGARLTCAKSKTSGFLRMQKFGSANIVDSMVGFSTIDGTIDFDRFEHFVQLHKRFDEAADLKAGRYPILFVSCRDFLHKLYQSLSPDRYYKNAAYYSGKLNQKIFNERINFCDIRSSVEYHAFDMFDHEGQQISPEMPIIKDGVFTSILHDRHTAQKYNAECTGNGRRAYNTSIRPSPYCLDFKSTGETIEQIYTGHDKVVVSVIAGGGDTTSNGDFSTPVQLGFLVENGVVVGKLPEITISNNIDKMMGDDFIAVPEDRFFQDPSRSFACYMDIMK